MNKVISAALLLAAGTALANAYTVTLDSSFYNQKWVYAWDNDVASGNWDSAGNWGYLSGTTGTTLSAAASYPANNDNGDPVFIGFEFHYSDGTQTMTSNDTQISVTLPSWLKNSTVYLGTNVTLTGSDNGFAATYTFNFGDFSGNSVISMGAFWKQPSSTVNFAGDIVMTGDTFTYTLFTAELNQNEGSWDARQVKVKDAAGNTLTYGGIGSENGGAGKYWLEEGTNSETGKYELTLHASAMNLPEPSSFGLLAGLGALALVAARRRRSRKA